MNPGKKKKDWLVYILRCSDESLYTGITNHLDRRLAAHNQGTAAKYTRSRRPVRLAGTSIKMARNDALRLEMKIKRLAPSKKIAALKKSAAGKPSKTTDSGESLCSAVKSLICLDCPNGCNLLMQWKDASNVLISGNKCAKGIRYAARVIRKDGEIKIHAAKKTPLFSAKALRAVAEQWHVRVKKIHRNISVAGSPERSLFRIVLEDIGENLFVLEQVPPKTMRRKKMIAAMLGCFNDHHLAFIQPYRASDQGEFVITYKNDFWQMMPYVRGVPLDRETYMYETWRGRALTRFLIALRRTAEELPLCHSGELFSLKNYIYKLIRDIRLYNRDIKDEIQDVAGFLEKDFLPVYEKLPVAFCHGDYHPMNVIWSEDNIRCVIDWEFCGLKSELYDAANLIGCVGVEDPRSLTGGLIASFIDDLREAGMMSPVSWKFLPEFVVALRFAWLSEWLRRHDTDMIRLELDYMRLLMEHKKILQEAWLR